MGQALLLHGDSASAKLIFPYMGLKLINLSLNQPANVQTNKDTYRCIYNQTQIHRYNSIQLYTIRYNSIHFDKIRYN